MIFLTKNDDLLKKYKDIWYKVSNSIFYSDEARDVHARKISEAGSNYIFWSVIFINCVYKKDKTYYPQVILKECKHTVKEKKGD